jgi:hypothetical protein
VLPGQELQIRLNPDNLPRRRTFPPYAAYGSAALAVASFAAGGFLGELSQLQPNGTTRQLAMDDLDQKRHFALAANISFGAGVVFGAISLYTFIRYHDDIFGRTERYDDTP